jgi:GntR family transcriptional regulator
MIVLDLKDARPIYEQIVERFKHLILCGALPEDEKLPSVRNLAMELSINPNTIQRAYGELERQGFIYTVKGRGNFVAPNNSLKEAKKEEIRQQILALVREGENLGMTEDEIIEYIRKEQKEQKGRE